MIRFCGARHASCLTAGVPRSANADPSAHARCARQRVPCMGDHPPTQIVITSSLRRHARTRSGTFARVTAGVSGERFLRRSARARGARRAQLPQATMGVAPVCDGGGPGQNTVRSRYRSRQSQLRAGARRGAGVPSPAPSARLPRGIKREARAARDAAEEASGTCACAYPTHLLERLGGRVRGQRLTGRPTPVPYRLDPSPADPPLAVWAARSRPALLSAGRSSRPTPRSRHGAQWCGGGRAAQKPHTPDYELLTGAPRPTPPGVSSCSGGPRSVKEVAGSAQSCTHVVCRVVALRGMASCGQERGLIVFHGRASSLLVRLPSPCIHGLLSGAPWHDDGPRFRESCSEWGWQTLMCRSPRR